MFLHELTAEQQRAFLVLARQVIAADDRLALQEVERLEALYRETGLPAETAHAPDVVGDLNYMFDTLRTRAVALLELLLVAHTDGEYEGREQAALDHVAEAMGVPEALWTDLQGWAARYAALVREAQTFGADG